MANLAFSSGTVLLTSNQVDEWKARSAALQQRINSAQQEMRQISRKLEAVAVITSDDIDNNSSSKDASIRDSSPRPAEQKIEPVTVEDKPDAKVGVNFVQPNGAQTDHVT